MASIRSERRSYALVCKDGSRKEFWADGAGQALKQAQTVLPRGRAATLVEDGVALAEIACSHEGFWSVSKPGRASGLGKSFIGSVPKQERSGLLNQSLGVLETLTEFRLSLLGLTAFNNIVTHGRKLNIVPT